jgi:hypothetical protein
MTSLIFFPNGKLRFRLDYLIKLVSLLSKSSLSRSYIKKNEQNELHIIDSYLCIKGITRVITTEGNGYYPEGFFRAPGKVSCPRSLLTL